MGLIIHGNFGSDKEARYESVSCPHCQQVRAIVRAGCTKKIPYHYWCNRCGQNICKGCAEAMEVTGHCPGPYHAKVEEAMRLAAKASNMDEARILAAPANGFVYRYCTTTKG